MLCFCVCVSYFCEFLCVTSVGASVSSQHVMSVDEEHVLLEGTHSYCFNGFLWEGGGFSVCSYFIRVVSLCFKRQGNQACMVIPGQLTGQQQAMQSRTPSQALQPPPRAEPQVKPHSPHTRVEPRTRLHNPRTSCRYQSQLSQASPQDGPTPS